MSGLIEKFKLNVKSMLNVAEALYIEAINTLQILIKG